MSRKCFAFEPSGHRFRPLDGIAGLCCRLYCNRCGRVIPADEAYNISSWRGVEGVDLPPELSAETEPDGSQPVH